MEHRREGEGDGYAIWMRELLGYLNRRLAAGDPLVGVPEEPEGQRRQHVATDPRVVPGIARGMQTVPLRVIQPHPRFQMGPGGGQLAGKEQDGPQGVVALSTY
jgi:hypothetical protein